MGTSDMERTQQGPNGKHINPGVEALWKGLLRGERRDERPNGAGEAPRES